MKINYSDDTRRGAGHGILTCRDADFPAGAWSMALLRASDQASLTGAGSGGSLWSGETRFLPVKTEPAPEGGLAVLLGPEVVNALDPLEQYLVMLKPERGEPLKARLQVRDITYSPDGALDNTGARAAAPAPAPAAAPQPTTPAAPPAEPPAPETPLTLAPEAPPAPRRLSPVLVVILVVALLAGGLGTWKFFGTKAGEEAAALSGGEAAPGGGSGAPTGTSLPATPKTAEEQVRAFFSGPDVTAAAALQLAAQLPKASPAEQDAVYRLYYFAAENEAPAAFLPYAACLDPAAPPWGSIDKDAAAAYAAYAKAAASDAKAAKAALEAQTRLRAWLDREAAAGNAQARAWLQELP